MLDWEQIKDAVNAARVDKYPDYKDDPMGCQPIPHWDLIERIVEEQVEGLVAHQRDDALETVGICPLCGQPDFGKGHACYGRDDDA
jgi:hypothetical protein